MDHHPQPPTPQAPHDRPLPPPPQNIRHALCPPYQTCPPPPFLLPNSAPCFLDPYLNGCTEIRGGPPIPGPLPTRGGGILICQSGNEIRGGPPVPGPPPMQGGTTLICRCSFEIRGGPPVPGLPPRQGGKTLMHRYSSEIRGGPPVPASAMQGDLGTVPRR